MTDADGDTDTATVRITVEGANDATVAADDAATTGENAPVTVDVLANDTDPDASDVLTVTSGGGTASVVNGKVVWDPGADYLYLRAGETAQATVTYTVADGHGATAAARVAVTVQGIENGPVAVADSARTSETRPVHIDVLANDTRSAPLSLTGASVVSGDTVTLEGVTAPLNPSDFVF